MDELVKLINSDPTYKFIAAFFIVLFLLSAVITLVKKMRDEKIHRKKKACIAEFATGESEISLADFKQMQTWTSQGVTRSEYANRYDFAGVYILRNTIRNRYYVGQSMEVLRAIERQLKGEGNKNLYRDSVAGDSFTVKARSLKNSRYQSLAELKSDFLKAHKNYGNVY